MRKDLSWRISNTLEAISCVEELNEAIHKFGPPEIVITDKGAKLTSFAWTDRLHGTAVRIPPLGTLLRNTLPNGRGVAHLAEMYNSRKRHLR